MAQVPTKYYIDNAFFCRSKENAICPEYVAGWIYNDYDTSWKTKEVKVVLDVIILDCHDIDTL